MSWSVRKSGPTAQITPTHVVQMTQETAALWFLLSESGEPLGQINRAADEAIPRVGAVMTDGAHWGRAEVVQFTELRQSCAVRRFRVVVRVTG